MEGFDAIADWKEKRHGLRIVKRTPRNKLRFAQLCAAENARGQTRLEQARVQCVDSCAMCIEQRAVANGQIGVIH